MDQIYSDIFVNGESICMLNGRLIYTIRSHGRMQRRFGAYERKYVSKLLLIASTVNDMNKLIELIDTYKGKELISNTPLKFTALSDLYYYSKTGNLTSEQEKELSEIIEKLENCEDTLRKYENRRNEDVWIDVEELCVCSSFRAIFS